ncbi:MAG: TonB-dependent receptor [Bacteroidetes bacterium]|nr:TonB-dependent receptor [Bacteroidota bacterium]
MVTNTEAKYFSITGHVFHAETHQPVYNLVVELEPAETKTRTDSAGTFSFSNLYPGKYKLVFKSLFFERKVLSVLIVDGNLLLDTVFVTPFIKQLSEVTIGEQQNNFGVSRLKSVDGVAVYDGKKNEVIVMKYMNANLAVNSSRQIFSKVPGINIWESDAAGLQIGIAARGLDPNRTSNFNTRQNGYDMSADALGYPESYYVPPSEAIERIEVVRGAASLQYGPQFGGMLNYVLHRSPPDKKIEWTSYTTAGAYKLVSTFNSIGGTVKCLNYYGYYNYKQGESWRPNGAYKLHNAFASIGYQCSDKLSLRAEYTFSQYIARQSGGLTDAQFNNNAKVSLRNRNWFSTQWNILSLSANYKHNAFHQVNVRVWGFLGSRSAVGYLGPANRVDDESKNRDLISDKYKNLGAEARYLWKYYVQKSLSSLLVGARFYTGVTQKQQGFANNGSDADFSFAADSLQSSDYKFPGMNVALFAENIFNIANRVKITPGIRYEHIQTKANGFYKQVQNEIVSVQKNEESRNFSRNFVLLGLGVSYHVWKSTELYANFSQNYRGITFTDMRVIRTSQIINPDLKDEKGFNFDLGYRGEIGEWFSFDVSAYWLQYNNRIGQIQVVDSAYNIFRYTTNVGTSRGLGAELYAEADFLAAAKISKRAGNLSLFVSNGYTNAIYVKSPYSNVIGNQLEFAPQITLRSGITYRYKKFSTTIQGAFTSKQFTDATNAAFTPTAVNGVISAYHVLDWSAKYAIKCVQLSAGVNNFTNNQYFTRRAISYPGPGVIPAEPLTFYVTVGIQFSEKIKQQQFNSF